MTEYDLESSSYRKIKELGEGSSGTVYLVEEVVNGKLFVAKEMLLNYFNV